MAKKTPEAWLASARQHHRAALDAAEVAKNSPCGPARTKAIKVLWKEAKRADHEAFKAYQSLVATPAPVETNAGRAAPINALADKNRGLIALALNDRCRHRRK